MHFLCLHGMGSNSKVRIAAFHITCVYVSHAESVLAGYWRPRSSFTLTRPVLSFLLLCLSSPPSSLSMCLSELDSRDLQASTEDLTSVFLP